MTTPLPTRICSHCGERFALTPRRGRNSSRRVRPGRPSLHFGARYCTATCRKAASKARRRSSTVARKAIKTLSAPNVLSSVTRAKNFLVVSSQYEGKKTGRGACLIGPHDYPINFLGGYRFPQAKPVPARGRKSHEALDREQRSLGLFKTAAAAANVVFNAAASERP
jgi:hypothetical protein